MMGKKQTNRISTSKDLKVVRDTFDSGNGIVAIDLNKVTGKVEDLSQGVGSGRVYSRTKAHKEVHIIDDGGAQPPVPPEAITEIEKPRSQPQ